METASACNIIPDEAMLCGTLRIFDQDLRKRIREDIKLIVKDVEKETKCQVDIDFFPVAKSPVDNDPGLTNKFMGLFDKEISSEKLPIFASEDFADYQEKVKGVFFFLAGGTKCGSNLHVDNYNFNDELIERAADIYFKVVESRFKDEDM
jgi:hippurate hydrolase